MRRAGRLVLWLLAGLLILPVLLGVLLLVALNLPPGRHLAERLVNQAAAGEARIAGLGGQFPAHLRIARIAVLDAKGSYAELEGVALDWRPWRLLHGEVAISRLAAQSVQVARLPVAGPAAKPTAPAASSETLPLPVDLARLRIDRLELAPAVLGAPAALAVDGSARLTSLQAGRLDVSLTRLNGPGTYHLAGRMDRTTLAAQLRAEEPAGGLIEQVGGVQGLGALSIQASVDGPLAAAATRLAVAAGPLRLSGQGKLDIPGERADLDLAASAPAMAPRPDLSWQSVALEAHVHGSLTRPEARATLRIADLAAAGASIRRLAADVTGNAGAVQLRATAEGVRVPGPRPDLLAAAPVALAADARLDVPTRPVSFALTHPLLALRGQAQLGGAMHATAHLDLPDLAPFAAAGGTALQGHAALDLTAADAEGTISATANGVIGITGGQAPVPALLGAEARLGVAVAEHGSTITLSQLQLDGRTLHLAAHGGLASGTVTLDWQAGLTDLAAVAPTVQGALQGHGHVGGPTDDLAVQAAISGDVATAQVPRGPISLSLEARGLPGRPAGRVTAQGTLDGAPLVLDASAERAPDGTLRFAIARADWKSAHAEGSGTLAPGATLPAGAVTLRMGRLDELRRLIGEPLAGSLAATASLGEQDGRSTAKLRAELHDAGLTGTATVAAATLEATIRDPATDPDTTASLDVTGLRAGTLAGSARLAASGKQAALDVRLTAALSGVAGADLQASGAATLDLPASRVTLAALDAHWKGETLRLLAPARASFAPTIAVDRLRLAAAGAELDLAGRLSPTLDLTASLRNVRAELARIAVPDLRAAGVLTAEARLTGTPARPRGTARLAATGLRVLAGPAASLPAASVTIAANLAGTTAEIDAHAAAGPNRIALAGTAPLDPAAAMHLRAQGNLNLALLNPVLEAGGRRVLGRVSLDATVTGTMTAPHAAGSLRLADGDVQDYVLGAHVTDIAATITADGDTVHIAHFSAVAGQGRIGARGTVGLAGPMPVDLELTAQKATPLASDKMTATLDAALTLRGALAGHLAASGKVTVDQAEIRIPDKLPASVPVLQVSLPGQRPAPPAPPPPAIGLDVTVAAPGQVFVRGRGLFAEMAGRIHVGGTAAAPVITGAFTLRQGQFDLAGTTLNFTSGEIHFEGSGKLDPALHLVATSTNGSIIATLTVSGFASAPKITLTSTPPLPQDEILAQLLFHQSSGSLSAFQLASVAAALAQISGVGGGVFDPLNAVRQGLGLSRLTVTGGPNGSGPALEAGRYVARGIYVGAKQAASGQGTQATVQIDLLAGLKLETNVGTGTSVSATGAASTTDQYGTVDPYGTSIGLTYQFQY